MLSHIAGIRKYNQNGLMPGGSWVEDENLSIDMVWLKSEYPYLFGR